MSETYKALTRTYRPRTFDDIVSQEHVTNTLKNAIKNNRLSHAYMFCGPRGVGKTTMARVLARTINEIDDQVDGEALNQTLNISEIDAASNNSVDDIRMLRENIRIPPQNGRYKIYIVDEVHMLSKAAFNALLKSLEEPPEHVIFIFATTEPHKVLPTILSRVQRFDFKRISVPEIVERLQKISAEQGIRIDIESLHVIAKKADGALRDALGLMDQAIAFCGTDIQYQELLRALNVVGSDLYFQLMDFIKAHDADGGLSFFDSVLQQGYDIQEFLVGLAEHLRNLYIAQESKNMHLVEASAETKSRYTGQSTAFSRDDLMRMLHLVSETQIRIKDTQQPRIVFEIMLIKLMHMGRSEELGVLITELEALKKKPENRELNPETAEKEAKNPAESHEGQIKETAEKEPELSSEQVHPLSSELNEPEIESVTRVDETELTAESDFDLIGPPALGNGNGQAKIKAHARLQVTERIEEPVSSETEIEQPQPSKKPELNVIREGWISFCEKLQEELSPTLVMVLQRVEPVELKGLDLKIRVEHAFAHRMIEEQKTDLQKRLKREFGCNFSLCIEVARQSEENKSESLSPYERFKNLQEKDPMIRTIVETFGAELEY